MEDKPRHALCPTVLNCLIHDFPGSALQWVVLGARAKSDAPCSPAVNGQEGKTPEEVVLRKGLSW